MHRVRATSIKPMAGMDVTAFTLSAIVMSLTLLVICMAGSPMISHGVSIDLPRARHPHSMWRAEREDAMMVAVFRTGDIFFGNDKLAVDQLRDKISARLRAQSGERKVYIRADARAKWGTVGEVLNQLRAAGVTEVGFLADQRRQ
jgi:biopolymer transport protein ExbD/biopolymer transport protein TolR